MKKSFLLLLFAVVSAVTPNLRAQSAADQQPTEAEIAASKRRFETLRHPTGIITIRLAAHGHEGSVTPPPYGIADWTHFDLFISLAAGEDLVYVDSRNHCYAYRPQLIRDGDILPYSKEAQACIERAEREPGGDGFSEAPGTLKPGSESLSHRVDLYDWYETPLKGGHYQLTVRRQFVRDGDWVESNAVTFDVREREPTNREARSEQSNLKLVLKARKEKHTFGDEIRFQQKMENESDGQAGIEGFDFYYQNRPKLLRDGKAVPYKSKTDELIRSKETDPGGLFISVRLIRIEPHAVRDLEELDLADWYDVLQPGSYQLTNKYRTRFDGPWLKESNEIQFRIEPKN